MNIKGESLSDFIEPLAGLRVINHKVSTEPEIAAVPLETPQKKTPKRKWGPGTKVPLPMFPGLNFTSPMSIMPSSPTAYQPVSPFTMLSSPSRPIDILSTPTGLQNTHRSSTAALSVRSTPDLADPRESNLQSDTEVLPEEHSGRSSKRSRADNCLHDLTQKFVELLKSSENGLLDLNRASTLLGVSKRRFYDITNVLEGVGLVKKISRNVIQWATIQSEQEKEREDMEMLKNELDRLHNEEQRIDDSIREEMDALNHLTEHPDTKQYSYMTYNDILRIPEFADHTVIGIRAPTGTALTVPDPKSKGHQYQISLKSPGEPIDIYMVKEDRIPVVSPIAVRSSAFPMRPVSSFALTPVKESEGFVFSGFEEARLSQDLFVDPGEREGFEHL